MSEQATTYTLYIKTGCPYCRKVMDFMNEHDIALPTMNLVEWPTAKEELVNIGGKLQVPCLVIDGKALYESDDIIAYMQDHLKELQGQA